MGSLMEGLTAIVNSFLCGSLTVTLWSVCCFVPCLLQSHDAGEASEQGFAAIAVRCLFVLLFGAWLLRFDSIAKISTIMATTATPVQQLPLGQICKAIFLLFLTSSETGLSDEPTKQNFRCFSPKHVNLGLKWLGKRAGFYFFRLLLIRGGWV